MTFPYALAHGDGMLCIDQTISAEDAPSQANQAILEELKAHFMFPISRGGRTNEILVSLDSVSREAYQPNWDSYGAKPAIKAAVDEAELFVKMLPSDILEPELAIEPNGFVGFEWRNKNNDVFVITFRGDNTLTYTGVLDGGNRKIYGDEPFDRLPNAVEKNILEYFSE